MQGKTVKQTVDQKELQKAEETIKKLRDQKPKLQEKRGDYIDAIMEEEEHRKRRREQLYGYPLPEDFSLGGNPTIPTVLTLYRFRPEQVKEEPTLWEINQALDKADFLLNDNKALIDEAKQLRRDTNNYREAKEILEKRLKDTNDYSKKLEGWLHDTARRAAATALVLFIVSILATINGVLALYFYLR